MLLLIYNPFYLPNIIIHVIKHNVKVSLLHFVCCLETKDYICGMKKELGKWLMDIAKYMATALLLSSAFGDMGNLLVVISVIIATALTLFVGLLLVKDKKEEKEI